MNLLACGINHKTAPIMLREKVAFSQHSLVESLRDLVDRHAVQEAAILSTCNRTEIYCQTIGAENAILTWLQNRSELQAAEIKQCLYSYKGVEAVKHILRVASGLDSMIIGEPQILGQLKAAFSFANDAGTIGKRLEQLFTYVFSISKKVRSSTGVGANPVTVAFAAFHLAKRIFSELASTQVLLIGTGEVITSTARYFKQQGVKKIIIANRTLISATKLAEKISAKAILLTEVPRYLAEADIVISATASPLPILHKNTVERALKARKHKPILMVDYAVPRDIDPDVSQLTDIYLYSIDDLQDIIQRNLQDRTKAALLAEEMIVAYADHFQRWLNSLDSASLIRDFRNKFATVRDQELSKALQQLKNGQAAHLVIARLAHLLTNKYLHLPSTKIREASYNGQLELIDAMQRIFELEANE